MKLKSLLPLMAVLFCLLSLSARCKAQNVPETYGTGYTNSFYCQIEVYQVGTQVETQSFNLIGTTFGATWSIDAFAATSITTTKDSSGNLHSTVVAEIYFTGGKYSSEPAIVTAYVTNPKSGSPTVGIVITDYYHPTTVLFTSGTTSGVTKQLPLTSGYIGIYL